MGKIWWKWLQLTSKTSLFSGTITCLLSNETRDSRSCCLEEFVSFLKHVGLQIGCSESCFIYPEKKNVSIISLTNDNRLFKGTSVPDWITISCNSESRKSSLVAALLSIDPDSKHNLSLSCPNVLWIVNMEAYLYDCNRDFACLEHHR